MQEIVRKGNFKELIIDSMCCFSLINTRVPRTAVLNYTLVLSNVCFHILALRRTFSIACQSSPSSLLAVVEVRRGVARVAKNKISLAEEGLGRGDGGGGVMLRCGLQRRSVSCLINGAASPRIANPKMALSTQSKPYPRYETIIWKPDNWNPQILNPNSRLKS